ncbi:hypothetical protein JVU11DRAFT_10158 [Chiua virens]|nr:hypothetical protein JVU11DRAFT_10158 [Chiua virens]
MLIIEDAKQPIPSQNNNIVQLNPSYHTSTPLLHSPPPPSYPNHHTVAPAVAVVAAHTGLTHRESTAKRFWKAFATALLLYLFLLSLAHTTVRMASRHSGHRDDAGTPRPEDGRVLQAINNLNWTTYHRHAPWAPSYPESAEASFVLPVGSEELYFLSRGSYQTGRVHVKQAQTTSAADRDNVKVDVKVAYHDRQALGRATVCRLYKSGNKNGVGIFTPSEGWSLSTRDRLYFDVVLTLPAAPSAETPLHINTFTTHTSNFAHEFGSLWRSVSFDKIDLNTSNAPIHADSITAMRGTLTSSNGAIVGHFNATDTLILHTSNARIQATASLLSATNNPTQFEMRTSNGAITSSASLITDSGTDGNFVVSARTSNGAISLQYDDAPLRVRLRSDARTSNAPASVVMHPAFEGTYEVSTSNSRPVVRDTRPVDPSGAGRRRVVRQTVTSRNEMSGVVHWTGGETRGASMVHTSNARASLDV